MEQILFSRTPSEKYLTWKYEFGMLITFLIFQISVTLAATKKV